MPLFDDLATPQIHETRLATHFGHRFRFSGENPVFDAPLICLAFSNRCGSNLLAGYLRDTPCFGGFHEQLNYDTVLKTCKQHDIGAFPDYISHLAAAPMAQGRLFGIKTSWDQLMMVRRSRVDRMFRKIHVIHMTRNDVLGQAISLMIADQTKQWTSAQAGLDSIRVSYRPKLLKNLVEAALRSEQMIRTVCETYGVTRTHVSYEDLVADPFAVTARIAGQLGANLADWQPSAPQIKRQATAQNDAFRARFLKEVWAEMNGPAGRVSA